MLLDENEEKNKLIDDLKLDLKHKEQQADLLEKSVQVIKEEVVQKSEDSKAKDERLNQLKKDK